MNPTRQAPPWALAGVAAAAIAGTFAVGSVIWNIADQPDLPDMSDREVVRGELSRVGGMRPVLPVRLPAGYDIARDYNANTFDDDPDPMALDETTTKRASSWSVYFFPKEDVPEHELPVIVFCVQDPSSRDEICPEKSDASTLQRQFGKNHLAIYRVSEGSRDMTAWSTLELTTDLDKVTWLH